MRPASRCLAVAPRARSRSRAASDKTEHAAPLVRPVLSHRGRAAERADARASPARSSRGYESNLGFRVLGRMIARDVNVGDIVKKGARARRARSRSPSNSRCGLPQADLSNAQAQLANATATETRQRTLLDTERHDAGAVRDGAAGARGRGRQRRARPRQSARRRRSSSATPSCIADFDGVVTATEAEVGQVVSAGQTVVIAGAAGRPRGGGRRAGAISRRRSGRARRFDVALQIDPAITASGTGARDRAAGGLRRRARGGSGSRSTIRRPSFRLGTTVTATHDGSGRAADRAAGLGAARARRQDRWSGSSIPPPARCRLREVRDRRARRPCVPWSPTGSRAGTRVVTAGVHSLAPRPSGQDSPRRPPDERLQPFRMGARGIVRSSGIS